jgi:hypothetical protein
MGLFVTCSQCDRKLRVPDELLGKKVKCPNCGVIFTAAGQSASTAKQETPPPAPTAKRKPPPSYEEENASRRPRPVPPPSDDVEVDEDDSVEVDDDGEESFDDRPRRPRSTADWEKVRLGVTLVLVSIWILVLIIPTAIVFSITAGRPQGGGPGQVREVSAGPVIGLVLAVSSEIVALVGYFFCRQAPQKNNAKTLATVCLLLAAGALVVSLALYAFAFLKPADVEAGSTNVMDMVRGLLNVVKLFVFIFFLKAVATCIRNSSLERNVKYLTVVIALLLAGLVLMIGIFVVTGAAAVAVQQQQGAAPGAAAAGVFGGAMLLLGCGCLEGILALTSVVMYTMVLAQTRNAITVYLRRG